MRGEDGLLVEAMGNGQKVSKAGLNARIKEPAERYAQGGSFGSAQAPAENT